MKHKHKSIFTQIQVQVDKRNVWSERILLKIEFLVCFFFALSGFSFWRTSLNLHCKSFGPWNNGTVPGTTSSSWESSIYSNFHSVRSKKKIPVSPPHSFHNSPNPCKMVLIFWLFVHPWIMLIHTWYLSRKPREFSCKFFWPV